jgi:glycosyltransferase involved in cell wall biosynthesis
MSDERPVILVLLGAFCRHLEATGPRESLINMARALSPRFRFRVMGWAAPGEAAGRWTELEGIEFLPLRQGRFGIKGLRRALRATPHDLLIMNSFFDHEFSLAALWLRRLGLVPRKPALLAPRGEFSPGALTLSPRRKRFFRWLAKISRMLKGVDLQVTTDDEAQAARAALPFYSGRIWVTPNIRTIPPLPPHAPRDAGAPLRVAFLSRIDRKKQLDVALDLLARAAVPVAFDIFGPATDADYWHACQARIAAMPAEVRVTYRGAIAPADVLRALSEKDLFFLPTLGENFGHAIADSLLAGTPVLISDQTPWRGLEAAHAGWDLPLADPEAFVRALRTMAAAGPDEQERLRAGARAFAEQALDTARTIEMTAACFAAMIGGREAVA